MGGHNEKSALELDAKSIQRSTSYEQRQVEPEKGDVLPPEAYEVFHAPSDGVNFRTVSWQRATVLFLKIQFAMSILAVPSALGSLGAVGGALSLVGWQVLNTYTALILGDFRNRHPECHTLADMCSLPLGKPGRELLGVMILVAQTLIVAAGLVSISTALNALSNHGACTALFTLVAAALVTALSSIRTFAKLGWLTWLGFITFVAAVLIFTVAVTQQARPAAAPQTGPFDLGFTAAAAAAATVAHHHPTFAAGMTATLNIFIKRLRLVHRRWSPASSSARCYLSLSLVIYRYCGQWLSSPAFGSAGPLFKKISYGVALPGLVVGIGIYSHVAAKYLFVRVLRDSRHLQANTVTHWATWLGINIVLGTLAFVVAEAVPILNYLLALAGSLCFAPFSLVFPAMLWMYDYAEFKRGSWKQRVVYAGHGFIVLVGAFLVIGGTYVAAISIRDAFASGAIGGVFQCADNSGSTT